MAASFKESCSSRPHSCCQLRPCASCVTCTQTHASASGGEAWCERRSCTGPTRIADNAEHGPSWQPEALVFAVSPRTSLPQDVP